MRAFIIDGSAPGEEKTSRLAAAIRDALETRGYAAETFPVARKSVAPCVGCDVCGYVTPGVCGRKDDGLAIVEGAARCDLMVFVSSIVFGSYASAAKLAIERTMPLLLPYFLKSRGEMHHRLRYEVLPSLLVAGYQEEADADRARIFRKLAERNGVNYLAPAFASLVVSGSPGPAELTGRIDEALAALETKPSRTTPMFPLPKPEEGPFGRGLSGTVLLVGAANCPKSNARAIMNHLAGRIVAAGGRCATLDLPASGLLRGNFEPFSEAVRSADRILLINPLYHDTISYAATRALEHLAGRRGELPSIPFGVFVHSGYPEPVHARTAVAVARRFAAEMGWPWMGALTAGATSPIGGEPLERAGRMTSNLRKGLDIAAAALAEGRPIPPGAVARGAKPFMPPFLYLWAGNYLIRKRAREKKIENLAARPYSRKP